MHIKSITQNMPAGSRAHEAAESSHKRYKGMRKKKCASHWEKRSLVYFLVLPII